jgi:hypothetical protein
VKVKFGLFGMPALTELIGASQIFLEFEGSTIADLLASLIKRYGAGVEPMLVDDEKRLHPYILVMINEVLIGGRNDREQIGLTEGDNIIFSIMAEGG